MMALSGLVYGTGRVSLYSQRIRIHDIDIPYDTVDVELAGCIHLLAHVFQIIIRKTIHDKLKKKTYVPHFLDLKKKIDVLMSG